jgi:fructose-1,6-bisphosphatase/inositol monophosphatase family enzyme
MPDRDLLEPKAGGLVLVSGGNMTTEPADALIDETIGLCLPVVQRLQRRIRDGVLAACRERSDESLSEVAGNEGGDTVYAIDRVGEAVLLEELGREAQAMGGLVLVAEGLAEGSLVLPRGRAPESARYRVIVDPIDGTRGLMYQKRSAWVLTGVAPNRGSETRLSDIVLSVQTEIPLVKQYLADELWAARGRGVHAERVNVLTGERAPLRLRPSRATSLAHGFAMVSRFFPGARDELAAIDEEIVRSVLGPPPPGRALCFEDQYLSSGGQLYELMAGHDRFNADLRPLLDRLLASRGEPPPLACHPYDVCAALIALEAGVILTAPDGAPLDAPLDLETPVAWVGYANQALRAAIEPALRQALRRRGLA